MKVRVIGLGTMGSGMAASLLRAGHEVTAYNRSPGRAGALVAAGAREAPDLDALGDVEAVIIMLTETPRNATSPSAPALWTGCRPRRSTSLGDLRRSGRATCKAERSWTASRARS